MLPATLQCPAEILNHKDEIRANLSVVDAARWLSDSCMSQVQTLVGIFRCSPASWGLLLLIRGDVPLGGAGSRWAANRFSQSPGHREERKLLLQGRKDLFLVFEDFLESALVLLNSSLIVKNCLLVLKDRCLMTLDRFLILKDGGLVAEDGFLVRFYLRYEQFLKRIARSTITKRVQAADCERHRS